MQINTLRPSHRFVLRALISVQKPARVIEFGAGLNSTQMLHELAPSFTSYESDPEWLDKIKTEVPGVDIRPLPLDVASYRIYPYQVPPETQRRIQADIARVVEDADLVFIDGFACMRIYALLVFLGHFNVCVCHDTEKALYWHRKAEKHMEGYVKVTVIPPNKHPYIDVIFAPQSQGLIPDFMAALQRECLDDYGDYADVVVKSITKSNASDEE